MKKITQFQLLSQCFANESCIKLYKSIINDNCKNYNSHCIRKYSNEKLKNSCSTRLNDMKKKIIMDEFYSKIFSKGLDINSIHNESMHSIHKLNPSSKLRRIKPFSYELEYISFIFPPRELNQLSEKLNVSRNSIKQYLLRNILLWRRKKSIANDQKLICLNYIEDLSMRNNQKLSDVTLSSEDYTKLVSLCNLDRSRIIKLVSRLKNPSKNLTKEKLSNLKNWIKQFNDHLPTKNELEKMSVELDLGVNQIKYLIWYYRQKRIKITKEIKEIIKTHLESTNESNINIDLLENLTKLSRFQIRTIIWNMKRSSKENINIDKLKIIDEFASNLIRNQLNLDNVSNLELEKLSEKINTPIYILKKHLSRIINRNNRNNMPKEIRDEIFDWFYLNKNLNKENLLEQARKCGISLSQIRSLHRQYTDPPQLITDIKKKQIKNWVSKNNRRPTNEEFQYLKNSIKLNSAQLSQLITRYLDPRKIITQENKEYIHKWMKERNYIYPTTNDLKELQLKIPISLRQIREEISKLKNIVE